MKEAIIICILILSITTLWVGYWLILRQWRKEQAALKTFKMWVIKKAEENVEQRCQHCQEGPECPGYNSGVIYPCDHYKERNEYGD